MYSNRCSQCCPHGGTDCSRDLRSRSSPAPARRRLSGTRQKRSVSVKAHILKSIRCLYVMTSHMIRRCVLDTFKDANMYPCSIQSLGSCLGIILSKLLTSLVQYSDFPCPQNLRVHVSKGTCSHDQYTPEGRGRGCSARSQEEREPQRVLRGGQEAMLCYVIYMRNVLCYATLSTWLRLGWLKIP